MEKIEKLETHHLVIMGEIEGGGTVWGYVDAMHIREIQAFDPELVHLVKIPELEKVLGRKFDGAKQLPYFGAVLTKKGKELLEAQSCQ